MNLEHIRGDSELGERLRFETLIADLSSKSGNLPPDEVDHEILQAQRRICETLNLYLMGLWQWSDEDGGTFILGLPLCRPIAEAHGGKLWAEPHAERGAVFLFELPVATAKDHP